MDPHPDGRLVVVPFLVPDRLADVRQRVFRIECHAMLERGERRRFVVGVQFELCPGQNAQGGQAGRQTIEYHRSQAGGLVEAVFEGRATGVGDQLKNFGHG